MEDNNDLAGVEQLLTTPGIADAFNDDRFKQFLDNVPVAIAVSEFHPAESIIYCNLEFERLTRKTANAVEGQSWAVLRGVAANEPESDLVAAILSSDEYMGTFIIVHDGEEIAVDAWSHTIQNDDGLSIFRLVTLAKTEKGLRVLGEQREQREQREQSMHDKDMMLRELQHRVKNNLQMITALIRMEARNLSDEESGDRFNRLAGRINSMGILYDLLSGEEENDSVDLGVYLSKIASSVMEAHAVEGIRLELKVDSWLCSIDVAMPTGLVVNELLTNALKHAFTGREEGTIVVSSLVDDTGCRIIVSDNGIGLRDGVVWPQNGKLGAMMVQSLQRNAKANIEVNSVPDKGLHVAIVFAREAADTVGR